MPENERRPGSAKRQILHGTNLAIYIVVVLAIIVLCNWFVSRNDHHLDLTPNKEFSLSPQTRKLLKGLDRPVTIYVFDRESGFRERRDLMRLYSGASHYISVQYVDPNRDPGLAHEFGVQNYGSIYVASGSHHLQASDASEEGITNALIHLLKGQKVIYFVQGHGERDLSGSDRDGYSKFKQALQNEDSDVKTLVLLQKMEIPSDCSMLVIAGPKNDYLPQETSAIEKYLKGGGRLLAFLDPGVALPNLSKLLSDYGVTMRNDLVIDENPVAQLFGTSPSMPLILSYGDSPIVQPLKRTATLFPLARSFEVSSDDKSGATLDQLCKTSQASFSVTNFNPSMREVSFRPGKDIKGPLVVAVAGTLTGGAPNKEGRFVAVGTSLIAANAYLGFQGNRDLIMNMVEWLASNEGLISIRPKAPAFQHLNLTASQMGGLLLRVMIIPVCIIIIGIVVWWSRR
ncbi:MAG TPA: GldG family protein [Terriglobia bacterium]|nr:GldG family protein [Terriglobia bacterium]